MAKCAWCRQEKAGESGYCETCLPVVKDYRKRAYGRLWEIEELSKTAVLDEQNALADEAQRILSDLDNRKIPYDEKKIKAQIGRIYGNCGRNPKDLRIGFWGKVLESSDSNSNNSTSEVASPTVIINNVSQVPASKKHFGGLYCPKCKGSNVSVISSDLNMKSQTSLNLNPLKPFTVFNHKKVEKTSAGKLALGALTGGTSLLFTGTKKKKHLEVFCQDCGHRWVSK